MKSDDTMPRSQMFNEIGACISTFSGSKNSDLLEVFLLPNDKTENVSPAARITAAPAIPEIKLIQKCY